MLYNQLNNPNPMLLSAMATRKPTETLPERDESILVDFCFCKFECDYKERVFYKVGGEDYQNDKSSFLYRVLQPTDTIVIKIQKDGQDVATIVDNTYGTFYPLGDPIFTNPVRNYSGVVIEWLNVFNAFGPGMYKIKAELTILGTQTDVFSHDYCLAEYTDCLADETVRLETIQNGCILNNPFDYTGLNWFRSLRLPGKFWNRVPNIEEDFYQNSQRRIEQVQSKIVNTYDLELRLIPESISSLVIDDQMLANEIFISDYNIWNHNRYRKFEVAIQEFDDPTYFGRSRKAIFVMRFTDRFQNEIKRNFK